MRDMTVATALANVEHLVALGQTTIHLYEDDPDFPFKHVVSVEEGCSYRLCGPSSARLIAVKDGLTFTCSIDFEQRDANGNGVHLFDRDRLRDLMRKLPFRARQSFAKMLEDKVLSGMLKTAADYRALAHGGRCGGLC